jgi:hypothetical protein
MGLNSDTWVEFSYQGRDSILYLNAEDQLGLLYRMFFWGSLIFWEWVCAYDKSIDPFI